jgi:pre-mRNA-processing factor SLU7
MVDSGAASDKAAQLVAEDGFMRASGDAAEFERAQRYAWETQERGDRNKLHLQANPTSGEVMRKKQLQEEEEAKKAKAKALAEKYGTQEKFTDESIRKLAVTENERYVEYDERGGIKGAPKIKAKSNISLGQLVGKLPVGICMLPLYGQELVLHWRGWQRGFC